MHFKRTVLAALVVGSFACSAIEVDPTLQNAPAWSLGNEWTLGVQNQHLMRKDGAIADQTWTDETLWSFVVDAEGLIDGYDAWRVTVTEAGSNEAYLNLYFRKADLGLVRIEETPLMHRGGAKQVIRNLFGNGGSFPVLTDNASVPYNFPAFGQPSGTFEVRAVIDGYGFFNAEATQTVAETANGYDVRIERNGLHVEQTWVNGQPWWSEQNIEGRNIARLINSSAGSALGSGSAFNIDTSAERGPRSMPLTGIARHVPWGLADGEAGEAEGVWSGHWWPMLEGPGKALLYADGGPMEKYDTYVQAITGTNPGAKAYEYNNHRTTDSYTGWWGHCHAWAAASIAEDEPTVPGTGNGVSFTVGDKKGLLTELYNSPSIDLWVGTRHNGVNDGNNNIHDDKDSPSYKDVVPYDFHRTLIEWIGIQGEALATDVNTGYQVWTYPFYKYEMEMEADPQHAGMALVTARVWSAGFASPSYVGVQSRQRTYTYRLTVDENGDPTPGPSEWTGSSVDDHPDFFWHPRSYGTGSTIRTNYVHEIVELGQDQLPTDDHPNRAIDTDADDTLVLDGPSLDGNIETAADHDYFRFDADLNMIYTIETTDLGAGSDTYIYVLDTDGTTELASNDDGGEGYASRITFVAPSTGTFYVRVRHYSPSGVGTYKIGLRTTELDPN